MVLRGHLTVEGQLAEPALGGRYRRPPQEVQPGPLAVGVAAVQVEPLDAVEVHVVIELDAVGKRVAAPRRLPAIVDPAVVVRLARRHERAVERDVRVVAPSPEGVQVRGAQDEAVDRPDGLRGGDLDLVQEGRSGGPGRNGRRLTSLRVGPDPEQQDRLSRGGRNRGAEDAVRRDPVVPQAVVHHRRLAHLVDRVGPPGERRRGDAPLVGDRGRDAHRVGRAGNHGECSTPTTIGGGSAWNLEFAAPGVP